MNVLTAVITDDPLPVLAGALFLGIVLVLVGQDMLRSRTMRKLDAKWGGRVFAEKPPVVAWTVGGAGAALLLLVVPAVVAIVLGLGVGG